MVGGHWFQVQDWLVSLKICVLRTWFGINFDERVWSISMFNTRSLAYIFALFNSATKTAIGWLLSNSWMSKRLWFSWSTHLVIVASFIRFISWSGCYIIFVFSFFDQLHVSIDLIANVLSSRGNGTYGFVQFGFVWLHALITDVFASL